MNTFDLFLLLIAWVVAAASPGPSTLAISAVAMEHGRKAGLAIASGIVSGSAFWAIAAAIGISKVMVANAWLFEWLRYAGAGYLLYLAIRSLMSAVRPKELKAKPVTGRNLYVKGALLHLTNPKAIFAWGSVYALVLPADAGAGQVWELFFYLIAASSSVFIGYGFLFSLPAVSRVYRSLKRWFDFAFATLFGAASLRLFTSRIEI